MNTNNNSFSIPPKGVLIKQWGCHIDSIGCLMPVEFKDLPFVPVRIFLVKNVPAGAQRGGHAHKQTVQYLFCMQGKIKVLLNDGASANEFILEKGQGCMVNKMVWDAQMFLTGDDVLMVFCSTVYDPTDYITDFEEFKKITVK